MTKEQLLDQIEEIAFEKISEAIEQDSNPFNVEPEISFWAKRGFINIEKYGVLICKHLFNTTSCNYKRSSAVFLPLIECGLTRESFIEAYGNEGKYVDELPYRALMEICRKQNWECQNAN